MRPEPKRDGAWTRLHPELARVVARFPEERLRIHELFMADQAFRSACNDYRLACDGLATFEEAPAATPRSVIEEYRVLVCDLEAEIMAIITAHGGTPGSAGRRSSP